MLAAALLAQTCAAIDLEATTLEGERVRGAMTRLDTELTLETEAGPATLDWSEVYELRPVGVAPEPAGDPLGNPFVFELADGSRFGGRVDGGGDGEVVIRFRSGQTARAPRAALRSIFATSADDARIESLRAIPEAELQTTDVALVAREQRTAELRGEVRAIDASGVAFFWRDKEVTLPWDRLVGLRLRTPAAREASAQVRIVGGDVLAGRIVGGDEQAVVLQSGVLGRVPVAWARIERIEFRSERLIYLSDAQPALVEFESIVGRKWAAAFDRDLLGEPIRMGGREFGRGIAAHSRTLLGWRVGGGFSKLAATAGVIDDVSPVGQVRMAVLGDGRVLWEASLAAGGRPQELLVDIAGVRELQLLVDFGDGLDLGDHAAWAEARLIR
jgi:hypothetical protein